MSIKALGVSGGVFILLSGLLVALWARLPIEVVSVDVALGLAIGAAFLSSCALYYGYAAPYRGGANGEPSATQRLLRSLEDLYVQIYKNSPVPYVLIGKGGVIISANMSAVRLFGTVEGALPGAHFFDLLSGDKTSHVSLFPEKFERGVFINDEEVSLRRTDGTTRWALFSLFSFTDSSGHKQGLATLVDVTKQKEIDKAKTEFVSLASHQLRTPLAAIKWNIELLLMKYGETLPPPGRGYGDAVATNVSRMDALVGDFLNASRFELGTLTAEKTTFELIPFLDIIVSDQSFKAEQKHIELRKNYDAASQGSCTTDAHLLGMTVSNLISNAIKYTGEGGVVRVETESAGNNIVIRVADTGMGIPKDEQDKIFSKIFRASNAQAHVPDGTGLGLYIAREAIKVLGGTLAFVSEQGVGTTFTITMPRV